MLYFCSYEITFKGNVVNRGQIVLDHGMIKTQDDYNKFYTIVSKSAKASFMKKSNYKESELFVHLISLNGLF